MMGAYPRKDRDAVAGDLETGLWLFSAAARNGSTSRPGSCRAASSRCWRSGGR